MTLFQHPLVAVDGSEHARYAAEVAIDLSASLGVSLDILSVEETLPQYVATHEETSREHAAAVAYFDALHAPLRQYARQRGVQVQCLIRSGHEGQMVLETLKERECDMLILGSQGHSGVWGAFLGSTADKLVSHAPCTTLVVRAKAGKSLFKHLLVALDGSPLGWQAFRAALQLASILGTSLLVLSVVEGPRSPILDTSTSPDSSSEIRQWNWTAHYQHVQEIAIAQGNHAGRMIKTETRTGSASSVLTSVAREENIDLLILGATGQEHPWNPITGGTARKVANEAPCAILLVRPIAFQQTVGDVMTTASVTVTPQTLLSEAMHLLIIQGVKLLIVVDGQQHVVGIVTLGHLLAQEDVLRHLDIRHTMTADQLEQHIRNLFATRKTVEDVMIRHPFLVRKNTSLGIAAREMLRHQVTRLPVVDIENTLVGILEQVALLRAYADFPSSTQLAPGEEHEQQKQPEQQGKSLQRIDEASLTRVPLVAEDTPLAELFRRVQETPFRRVIVVNHVGKAVGVIGDRDLLTSQKQAIQRTPIFALAGRFALRFPEDVLGFRSSSGSLTARQIMRPHLYSVTPTTPLVEVVRLMLTHQIKRLVVVDETGKPLGLVDRQHLLRSLVEAEGPLS